MLGVLSRLGTACYTHAITQLPLGDAITAFNLYPILAAFTARMFLKEEIKVLRIFVFGISFICDVLISQPSTDSIKNSDCN